MNIIAQFIWTISDVLGVIGLLITLLTFGVAYVWAKLDTRRRRFDFERRKNAAVQRPGEAGSVARAGSPAERESRPQQPERPQSPAKRGIDQRQATASERH